MTFNYADLATLEWVLEDFREGQSQLLQNETTAQQRRTYQNRCRRAQHLLKQVRKELDNWSE